LDPLWCAVSNAKDVCWWSTVVGGGGGEAMEDRGLSVEVLEAMEQGDASMGRY